MADFLLKEDSDKILLETEDKIILEQSLTEVTTTIQAKANVRVIIANTIQVKANIQVTIDTNIQAKARIEKTISTNIQAKASIIIGYATAIQAKAGLNPATKAYSKEAVNSLPSDNDRGLPSLFLNADYVEVLQDDDEYVNQVMANFNYAVILFKDKKSAQLPINVIWKGKSSLAPSSSTVYLQIFNRDSDEWETLDSNNSTAANTKFTLQGQQLTDLENYYDVNYWLSFRAMQQTD